MGLVRIINDEGHFQAELSSAGTKLVVVDFTASWCGPCQIVAPVFDSLSTKYSKAIFLKVDVDKCPDTAASQGVSAMPTFIFYRNKTKIDRQQGGDAVALEARIKQHYGSDNGEECEVSGYMDLVSFVIKDQCECLNESEQNNFLNCQNTGPSYLESDCDEQLIISITFSQSVKLHSIKIKGPADKGPKEIKLFINQPRTLDFDTAEKNTATQELVLTPTDLQGGAINLKYVKFQNVYNLQIFVKNNQNGGDVTVIEHLGFIGLPISTTNMGDLKRVVGKKGESH